MNDHSSRINRRLGGQNFEISARSGATQSLGCSTSIFRYGTLCSFTLLDEVCVLADDFGYAVLVLAYSVGEGSALDDRVVFQ